MPREKKHTRRGNNEGSIYQRSDGRWAGEVLIGYKPDGKPQRKAIYGKTRQEVAQKVQRMAVEVADGKKPLANKRTTLAQWIDEWLDIYCRPRVTGRTLDWYSTLAQTHIAPILGMTPLQKLTALKAQHLFSDMQKSGKSDRTIKAVRNLLRQIMEQARKVGHVTVNPILDTDPPRRTRKPDDNCKALSQEMRVKVLTAAQGDIIMKPIVTTLLFTGLRSGELLALTWDDIDFNTRRITVHTAVTKEGKNTVISEPKTRSGYRTLVAPQQAIDALREWKTRIDKRVPNHSNFVFCNTRTGGLRTYQGFRSSFIHFLERNNLPHITLHMFRHTHATMLLEQGVNMVAMQKQLGHADIGTTLGIYSHVMPEIYEQTGDTLSKLYECMAAKN
ncbi:MAG: site-specific integrase [Oscillospiraceae bacterium]|jgi:integrase|nr:site-specific integrase [Oscillospiraceae bacterium]